MHIFNSQTNTSTRRPTEHLVANNPVLVREDEPSSLLAYALAYVYSATESNLVLIIFFSSSDYREKITYFQQDTVLTEDRSEVFMPGDGDSSKTHGTNNSSGWGLVDVAEASSAGDVEETPKLPLTEHFGLRMQRLLLVSPARDDLT